jgi:hypothetical protein
MGYARLFWLVSCIGLTACGVASATKKPVPEAEASHGLQPTVQAFLPGALADVAQRYFPLERYQNYPESIRPILQAYFVANDQCRGIPGIEQMRACNRRQRVHVELDRRGWCWGGATIEAEMHWVPCAQEEWHQPGRIEAAGPHYPEFRIRWEENRERFERGETGVGPLPTNWEDLLPSTTDALSVSLDPAAARRFPLSRYRGLPAAIRPLLQRLEVFDERCSAGTASSHADLVAACRRELLVMIELERRGWCHFSSAQGWSRCSTGAGYRPGEVAATSGHLDPESYVRWWRDYERREGPARLNARGISRESGTGGG